MYTTCIELLTVGKNVWDNDHTQGGDFCLFVRLQYIMGTTDRRTFLTEYLTFIIDLVFNHPEF